MIGQKGWKICLVAVPFGIMLLANSSYAGAAPVELSLDDSIALALQNNPSVKMAEADKIHAVWMVTEAKAEFGPSLKYNHIYTRTEISASTVENYLLGSLSSSTLGSTYNGFENRITLSLPLYTGGKREGLLDQAQNNLQVTSFELQKTKQQLKLDTTTAYFNALQARNLLKINQESLDNLAAHLKNVQVKYDEGLVNKSDVLRSEVELANAQQDLMTAQNDYNLAIASLNNAMGLPLNSEVKVKEELTYQKYTLSLDECIKYALHYHPEVMQTQIKLNTAKCEVKVAKSDNLPQISFNGSNDWYDEDFPGTKDSYWMVSLTASFNVFDSGLIKSKVKKAEVYVDKAQEQARQTREAVALEVSYAYQNLKVAENRIETSRVVVDKAQEVFRIAEIRYNEGVGTNLDVIDAQLTLAQAKTKYNQARYDYSRSKAKLIKAMGID